MKFIAIKTAPSTTNKWYLKAGKGGYNKAMEIDKKTHSCLPNCCGLVHGRWLECRNETDYNTYDKLSTGDAGNYYKKKDGYARGQTPKLGAVICFSKDGGAGHVAFVEEIKSNGDIVISNSAYKGTRFFMKTLTKKSGYSYGSKYHLQGFIYNPVEFNTSNVTPTVERDETKDQLKVLTTELRVRENHTTNAVILGVAQTNGIYNYYETFKDDKYIWYRIADNQWIANNGEWLEIYPKKESEDEMLKETIVKLEKENLELKQINAKLEQELEDNINNQKDYKCVYKCLKSGNYNVKIYLKENECLYIK